MGRLLKRVPLDFDWPIGHVWKGYINPYASVDCPYCYDEENERPTGYTREAWEYYKTFYGHLMEGAYYITHPYDKDRRYCPQAKPYTFERWEYEFSLTEPNINRQLYEGDEPPAYEDLKEYFLRKPKQWLGLDSYSIYVFTEEYCRRNGYETLCPHCKGEYKLFLNEEIEKLHNEFEKVEPPTGDGYQLWENTSEGSPKSPVFATKEELAEWCADNATIFAGDYQTKEEWLEMFKEKDSPFVYKKGGIIIT